MDSCAACDVMHKECNACELKQRILKEAADSFALLIKKYCDSDVVKMMEEITPDRRLVFIRSLEVEAFGRHVDHTTGPLGGKKLNLKIEKLLNQQAKNLILVAQLRVERNMYKGETCPLQGLDHCQQLLIAEVDREFDRLTGENITLQSEVQKLMEEDMSHFKEKLHMLRSSMSEQQSGGTSKKRKLQVQGLDGNEDGRTSKKRKLQVQGMDENEEAAKDILDGNEDGGTSKKTKCRFKAWMAKLFTKTTFHTKCIFASVGRQISCIQCR
ncbi:hypothetical protein POM88_005444 [Heracleum sosnowskyi]|uniref:LOB domain-containing protein n=1 Tax=Heracleum sosnowskyi TaxID=360622 RepID=A0AAD8N4H9_9APIA|nr:hypothetical protein POM88_005444 [Heracleum sosnowskyi]